MLKNIVYMGYHTIFDLSFWRYIHIFIKNYVWVQ